MQYVTGYILTNLLDVQMHTDGLERRFEKVYERPIKLYREFDNSFTIVVKNQDQKKQFVNDASCELQISDEDNKLVLTIVGVVQDDGSSTATKGHIKFTITESNMLDLDGTFYTGALRFTGNDSTVQILYADTRYDAGINFEVVKGVSPEFIASQQITTGASYGTDSQQTEFFQIDRQDYTEQSGVKYVNFTGVFERVAFVAQMTDSSTVLAGIDKILYRP